jgi:N6-adenosine-specific RNA methylase IME4
MNLIKELHALAGLDAGAILLDPPIGFEAYSVKGEGPRSPQGHYHCSPIDELKALPLAGIAARDCFMFLWVPKRSTPLVEPLMNAWGWKFSGSAFTWAKLNADSARLRKLFKGQDAVDCITHPKFWAMITGYGTRQNTECCWLGRRGDPKRLSKGVRELIVAPRREHSRKPDEVYERIEALCAGPYVEIFARQCWPGWTRLGDEIDKFQPARLSSEDLESTSDLLTEPSFPA